MRKVLILLGFLGFVIINQNNQTTVPQLKNREIEKIIQQEEKIESNQEIKQVHQEVLNNTQKELEEFVNNELRFNQQQMYENELVFCDLSLENELEESHLKSICLNYHLKQEVCLTYKKHCPDKGFAAKEEELLYFLHPMEVVSYLKKRQEQEAYQINPLDPPKMDTAYWDRKLEELKVLKQRMDF